jgi:hypothetical protein
MTGLDLLAGWRGRIRQLRLIQVIALFVLGTNTLMPWRISKRAHFTIVPAWNLDR